MRGLLLTLLVGGLLTCVSADAATAPSTPAADPVRRALDDATKLYKAGQYEAAAKIYQDAIKTTQNQVGPMANLNRAVLYDNLGTTLFAAKKYAEADAAYQQSLELHKKMLKAHASVVANTLQHYGALLRKTGRAADADAYLNQADFLLVGDISGQNPVTDVKSEPRTMTSSAIPATGAAPSSDANKPTTRVLNVIVMTTADKSILDNPLTMQKPVYRNEPYYEGGVVGPNGTVVRKTRQVLDHYETVPVADGSPTLSYVNGVAGLQRAYGLSASTVKTMCDAINSGGSAVELANNWLMLTDESLDSMYWHSGCDVDIARTPEGNYVLTTKDGRGHCMAKRVAIK